MPECVRDLLAFILNFDHLQEYGWRLLAGLKITVLVVTI
jgi:hypothetical protein